jgi:hypothetical protein
MLLVFMIYQQGNPMSVSDRDPLRIAAVFSHRLFLGLGLALAAAIAAASTVVSADAGQPEVQQDGRSSPEIIADIRDDVPWVPDVDDLTDSEEQAEQQRPKEQLRVARALKMQLDELSGRVGAYDASLLEVQTDLGQAYLSAGQVDEAIDVLGWALQLARVTEGLYSERQLVVLARLIEAHYIKRDWAQVDDYQHLSFLVKSRLYAPESAEYAEALLALAEWRLKALRANLLGRSGGQQTLQMLHQLRDQNEEALGHARSRADVHQQWSLLYVQALMDVEISRQYNYQSLIEGFSAQPRYITQTVCRMVATGDGGAQRVCWQETVSNPEYYNSEVNQRRAHLERARLRLQSTLRDMDTLLEENPGFALEYAERTQAGRQNIQRVVSDLQREARRTTMRY